MTQQKLTDAIASTDTETIMWKSRFSAAKAAYAAADFRQCQTLLYRALEQAHALKEREFATNTCLVGLGAVHLALGDLEEANKHLEDALRALSGAAGPALQELYAVALRIHASVLFEKGELDASRRELQQAATLLEGLGSEGAVQLSYALSDLATIHITEGELKEAKELIISAMDILRTALGQENPQYLRANVIYNICQSKNEEEFLGEVENSIVRMQYQVGEKHPSIVKAIRWYLKRVHEHGDTERIAEAESLFGMQK